MNGHDGTWPELRVDDWTATRETLHRWVQIVGKVRLALSPVENHWWHVPLYVNAIGLTTSLMPAGGRGLEIQFDFVDHRLLLDTTDGRRRTVELMPRTVSDFHREVGARLAELDVLVSISPRPVVITDATPFDEDHHHASYDPDAAHLFWLTLVKAHQVLQAFRGGFRRKGSPVHFFWGGFDLAVTRFSGRPVQPHPGGARRPSDEGFTCGFWPGGTSEGSFYAAASPEPPGYRTASIRPDAAFYDPERHEFLLPYSAVRRAEEPDAFVREFLDSSYDVAAQLADWPAPPVRER